MNKTFITTVVLCSILMITLSTSCKQSSDKKEEPTSELIEDTVYIVQSFPGLQWLKSIFQCEDNNGFCFPDEEKVTTARYYEYFIETIGIYEYPMFETEDERIAAEQSYKNKWKDIYPLDGDVSYPFGRGNGIGFGDPLKDVILISDSDTEHVVLINYGGGFRSVTLVTLVPNGDSYLIDYMKTENSK